MLPDGASLQRTDAAMKEVERVVSQFDAVQNSTVISGYSMLTSSTLQPNAGFVFLQLKDWDERPEREDHATNVVRRLNAAFATGVKGGVAFAFGPPAIPGLGTGAGFSMGSSATAAW